MEHYKQKGGINMWTPFWIVLNVVCGIILAAYIIYGIRKRKRIKEAKKALFPEENNKD